MILDSTSIHEVKKTTSKSCELISNLIMIGGIKGDKHHMKED